jgi:hypothetical protein
MIHVRQIFITRSTASNTSLTYGELYVNSIFQAKEKARLFPQAILQHFKNQGDDEAMQGE